MIRWGKPENKTVSFSHYFLSPLFSLFQSHVILTRTKEEPFFLSKVPTSIDGVLIWIGGPSRGITVAILSPGLDELCENHASKVNSKTIMWLLIVYAWDPVSSAYEYDSWNSALSIYNPTVVSVF